MSGWLRGVVLVLALGVALMHHLVGAHQHGGDEPVHAVHAVPAPDPGTPTAHAAGDLAAALPVDAHPDGQGSSGVLVVLLHTCLAVLAGVLLAAALAVLGPTWRPTAPRIPSRPLRSARRPRPPAARRLAELQILRL